MDDGEFSEFPGGLEIVGEIAPHLSTSSEDDEEKPVEVGVDGGASAEVPAEEAVSSDDD